MKAQKGSYREEAQGSSGGSSCSCHVGRHTSRSSSGGKLEDAEDNCDLITSFEILLNDMQKEFSPADGFRLWSKDFMYHKVTMNAIYYRNPTLIENIMRLSLLTPS